MAFNGKVDLQYHKEELEMFLSASVLKKSLTLVPFPDYHK